MLRALAALERLTARIAQLGGKLSQLERAGAETAEFGTTLSEQSLDLMAEGVGRTRTASGTPKVEGRNDAGLDQMRSASQPGAGNRRGERQESEASQSTSLGEFIEQSLSFTRRDMLKGTGAVVASHRFKMFPVPQEAVAAPKVLGPLEARTISILGVPYNVMVPKGEPITVRQMFERVISGNRLGLIENTDVSQIVDKWGDHPASATGEIFWNMGKGTSRWAVNPRVNYQHVDFNTEIKYPWQEVNITLSDQPDWLAAQRMRNMPSGEARNYAQFLAQKDTHRRQFPGYYYDEEKAYTDFITGKPPNAPEVIPEPVEEPSLPKPLNFGMRRYEHSDYFSEGMEEPLATPNPISAINNLRLPPPKADAVPFEISEPREAMLVPRDDTHLDRLETLEYDRERDEFLSARDRYDETDRYRRIRVKPDIDATAQGESTVEQTALDISPITEQQINSSPRNAHAEGDDLETTFVRSQTRTARLSRRSLFHLPE